MEFDTADMASMEANGTLMAVVMHEMGHVLGVGTIWSTLGLLSGRGTTNPTFTGSQATAAYNQIFNTNVTGVPVENTGGGGTRDAHWRETIFKNELMTGWTGPGTVMPLSLVTAASLADMGYTVNLAMADPFTPSVISSLLVQQTTQTGVDLISRKFFSSPGLGDAIVPGTGFALQSTTTASADSGVADFTVTIDQSPAFSFVEQYAFPKSARTETLRHPTKFDAPALFNRDAIDAVMTRTVTQSRDNWADDELLSGMTEERETNFDSDEAESVWYDWRVRV
jgi:Leishmanolysin